MPLPSQVAHSPLDLIGSTPVVRLSAAVMAVAAVAIVVAVTSLSLWARPFAGYHHGTVSGIYLALVVTAATVTTVSAARGTRAALAQP